MARYRIENCIVDTENATNSWDEDTRWGGSNHVSIATGGQWSHDDADQCQPDGL